MLTVLTYTPMLSLVCGGVLVTHSMTPVQSVQHPPVVRAAGGLWRVLSPSYSSSTVLYT